MLTTVGTISKGCCRVPRTLGLRLSSLDLEFQSPSLAMISNRPLRMEFLRRGMTLKDLAARLGWIDGSGASTRLARALGLQPVSDNSYGYRREVTYEVACQIALAMDMDPVDAGI